jgi:hypothetical protein
VDLKMKILAHAIALVGAGSTCLVQRRQIDLGDPTWLFAASMWNEDPRMFWQIALHHAAMVNAIVPCREIGIEENIPHAKKKRKKPDVGRLW